MNDKRPAKYIIGLTGSIGTGKSLVRQMLEALGAAGIDADEASHRVIEKNTPGYAAVLAAFGPQVLTSEGEIDRPALGRRVFSDRKEMAKLEAVIHPQVTAAVEAFIQNAESRVIVVEAIKLLESSLLQLCDAVWVVTAAPGVQLKRLVEQRGLSPQEARQRIDYQGDDSAKLKAAHVIIENNGSLDETRQQVMNAWLRIKLDPAA